MSLDAQGAFSFPEPDDRPEHRHRAEERTRRTSRAEDGRPSTSWTPIP